MKLDILFINDVHAYLEPHQELIYEEDGESTQILGGYARIKGLAESIRNENPNTLFFDGGDTFHGTKPIVDSKGEDLIPVLKELKLDAMVAHWEFAYGPAHLKELAGKLGYPVLACNVFNEDGTLFSEPSTMLEIANLKIGVVGVACMIVDKTMPKHFSKGIYFTSGVEEIQPQVDKLRKQGADIIILLSHNGFPQDMYVLEQVKGVDICLSSHTHNRIYDAIEQNGTTVIQCGCHGSFLGRLTLEIENKEIKDQKYELIKVDDSITPDEKISAIVDKILEPYREIRNNIVGTTTTLLHRYSTFNSTLDDLLLRAICHASDTDISFSNGWRYGIPIPAGDITENDLHNIVPVNPPVSTVEISGSELKEMLEENLEKTFSKNPLDQMGGYVKRCYGLMVNLRVEHPKGHRIQEILYKGKRIEPNKFYKVSFITSQGVSKKYGRNRQNLDIDAVEAMKNFLAEHQEFTPSKNKTYRLV